MDPDYEHDLSDEDSGIEVLYNAAEIFERVQDLADLIATEQPGNLLVIAVLRGSFIFAGDLLRAMHEAGLAPEVDFMSLASYHGGTESSGEVKVLRDVDMEVEGRNILIIDDILESGRTLAFAKGLLLGRGAKSVATCVLLDKPVERKQDIKADYVGFTCPKVFVVGYGMDLDHRYRELPYIGRILEN